MKKSILNIGKALNKEEQKSIQGGSWVGFCFPSEPKCNHYCPGFCLPCGLPSGGFTPHECVL